jgi:hypothetical protein
MRNAQTVDTSYRENTHQLDFYGTINEDNTPHITLLTSLHQYGNDMLIWGEYCAGLSKENQKKRPKIGFLSVIDNKSIVMGKADWVNSKTHGEELELLNRIPQFRYNNVYGYSPVHILKIREMNEDSLPSGQLAKAIEQTKALVYKVEAGSDNDAISLVTREFLETEDGIKVLAYIDKTGYPRVIPLPQAKLAGGNRVIFVIGPYKRYMRELEEGIPLAIYALSYKEMGSVLVHGIFTSMDIGDQKIGVLDVTKVYNPMLPVTGYVYPKELAEIRPVTVFEDVVYEYNV